MRTIAAVICIGQALLPNASIPSSLWNRIHTTSSWISELVQCGQDSINIIFSGGDPKNVGKTEAKAMMESFYSMVPVEISSKVHCILEEQSNNTMENFVYCNQILRQCSGDLCLVTSDFHLPRAKLIAQSILGANHQLFVRSAPSSHRRLPIYRPMWMRPKDHHQWNMCEIIDFEVKAFSNINALFARYGFPPPSPSTVARAMSELKVLNETYSQLS